MARPHGNRTRSGEATAAAGEVAQVARASTAAVGNDAARRLIQRLDQGQERRQDQRHDQDGSRSQGAGPLDPAVAGAIDGARGGGAPLPQPVGEDMGARFGVDFAAVRVHTDGRADTLSRSVQATAFTTGTDIFFSRGAYDPGSATGQELLAHELTHVVQQAGASGGGAARVSHPDDAAEVQARQVARAMHPGLQAAGNQVVARLLAPRQQPAGPATLSAAGIQREPDASMPAPNQSVDPLQSVAAGPAPTGTDLQDRRSMPETGAYSGRKIGTVGRWIETDLKAGVRDARNCQTAEEAGALARGQGRASAVIREPVAPDGSPQDAIDAYVIYPIVDNSWFSSLTAEGTRLFGGGSTASIKPEGGIPLVSIVTTDGMLIQPMYAEGQPDPKQYMLQQGGPGAGKNPFDGFREAFGAGMAGLDGADKAEVKEQFLRVFELALRDTALATLDTSEAEAAAKMTELEQGLPDADIATIERELPQLIRINDELRELSVTLVSGEYMPRGPGGELHPSVVEAGQRHDELMMQRSELFLRYPLLSQVDPVAFKSMSPADRTRALRGATREVIANIATTRGNILGGSIELWLVGPLLQATLAGLGVSDADKRGWALQKAEWEHTKDDALGIAFGVFMVGLGLAAIAFTGGAAGVALAAGALTVGVADAASVTATYFQDRAAANTDLNKDETAIPKDLEGQWVWVAVAWLGVGLDAQAVFGACRAAQRAGLTLEKAAEQLAEQVRRTPGDLVAAARRFTQPLTAETARAVLVQALSPAVLEQYPHLRNVPVTVLKSADFEARFGSAAGEAVTNIRKGAQGELTAEVIVKETATPRSIADEAVHLEQSVDPELAAKLGSIADLRPDAWAKLKLAEQLPQFEAKLELEIDAARRSLAEVTDADDVADLQGTVADLEKYLADVRAAMRETDPAAMLKRVPWWDPARPPWLFAKARLPKTNGSWSDPLRPGNCLWYSDHPDVQRITGGKGVPFRNNYPVFKDWAEATVVGDFSAADHFAQADRAWARQLERRGLRDEYPEFFKANGEINASAVERWRVQYGYTWHHHQGEGELMLLLPRDLHANVPHTGGHARARGTHTP